jgi:biopolymer transport protein ExbD
MQMAAITIPQPRSAAKKGLRRIIKRSTGVDLTPMVDLGFILITFFLFTTSMTRPKAMQLNMPYDKSLHNPTLLCESCALTVILAANDQLYYYEGKGDDPKLPPVLRPTTFDSRTGLGKVIRDKQEKMRQHHLPVSDIMVLIKSADQASYQNMIDVIDEMLINQVEQYAILNITDLEKKWIGL